MARKSTDMFDGRGIDTHNILRQQQSIGTLGDADWGESLFRAEAEETANMGEFGELLDPTRADVRARAQQIYVEMQSARVAEMRSRMG